MAATTRELAPAQGWRTLLCGVGPVDSAVSVARALAEWRPAAVVHVGIAGTRRASGVQPMELVIGTESRYTDLVVPEHFAPRTVAPDAGVLAAVRAALPDARACGIGTSARVGGTTGCDVEAMEGFAVLRAAQVAGIPAIEVRVISNYVEETDRSLWRFDEAFAAITMATPRLVEAVARCVN